MGRYAFGQFVVTVENLLLDYEQRVEVLGRWRDGAELEALRGVRGALGSGALGSGAGSGAGSVEGSLCKREALVLLGRHYRPPGTVLLRLRERVQRGTLDVRSGAVAVEEAKATVAEMLLQSGLGQELEAWRQAACYLSSLPPSTKRVHLGALLRLFLETLDPGGH